MSGYGDVQCSHNLHERRKAFLQGKVVRKESPVQEMVFPKKMEIDQRQEHAEHIFQNLLLEKEIIGQIGLS